AAPRHRFAPRESRRTERLSKPLHTRAPCAVRHRTRAWRLSRDLPEPTRDPIRGSGHGRPAVTARLVAMMGIAAGCAACSPASRAPPSTNASSKGPPVASWQYVVETGDGAGTLSVRGDFKPTGEPKFSVDDPALPFVRDVRVLAGHGWRAVPPQESH